MLKQTIQKSIISDRVAKWSANETVDLGSISGRINPKIIQFDIHCLTLSIKTLGQVNLVNEIELQLYQL